MATASQIPMRIAGWTLIFLATLLFLISMYMCMVRYADYVFTVNLGFLNDVNLRGGLLIDTLQDTNIYHIARKCAGTPVENLYLTKHIATERRWMWIMLRRADFSVRLDFCASLQTHPWIFKFMAEFSLSSWFLSKGSGFGLYPPTVLDTFFAKQASSPGMVLVGEIFPFLPSSSSSLISSLLLCCG